MITAAIITGLNLAIMILASFLVLRAFNGWADIRHPFLQVGAALITIAAGFLITPARMALAMGFAHTGLNVLLCAGLLSVLLAFVAWHSSIEIYRHGLTRRAAMAIWTATASTITGLGAMAALWIG